MFQLANVCSCIRGLHPDLRLRVKEETLLGYQKHPTPFLAFLQNRWELAVLSAEDVDL